VVFQEAEGGKQKAEGGKQKAEGGRQKAEGGKQTAEGGRRKSGFSIFHLRFVICYFPGPHARHIRPK
jgi:hypothetical protein